MIIMRTCEKGIAVGVVVAVVVVVAAAAAVGGYLVLSHGIGGAVATSGTGATVTTGGEAINNKFDFSSGSTVSGDTGTYDFAIEPWVDQYGVSGPTPVVQGCGGIDNLAQDMGPATLASVTVAPGGGYYPDVPASNGHTFVIKCHNGNYAKFHITGITYTNENYPATITFDWVYQPNGSLSF